MKGGQSPPDSPARNWGRLETMPPTTALLLQLVWLSVAPRITAWCAFCSKKVVLRLSEPPQR